LIERPNRIIVAFKDTNNYNKVSQNSLTYDHLNLSKIQLRAGSGTFYPDQPIESVIKTGTSLEDDYIRNFEEFLRVSDLQHNLDGGSLVNYASFKSLYPFYCFDLRESWQEVLFGSGQAIDVTIEANVTLPSGTKKEFEMFVFICSDRRLNLDVVGGSMLLSVK
jgi:hypothetical protein